jgi:hypothetical protein
MITVTIAVVCFLLGLEAAHHVPPRTKKNTKMIYPPERLNKLRS